MSNKLLFRLAVLVAAMMCALGANADEAYACYTSSNTTLTFYYDNQRSSRTGVTYDLNTSNTSPSWWIYGTCADVTKVVFMSSFANARPTSTSNWFRSMRKLESIIGLSYLNTSEVIKMDGMFYDCNRLTSLDLSSFNTSNVTNMDYMFSDCSGLTSLGLSSFNTSNVTNMAYMFDDCSGLTSLDLSSFNTSNVTTMAHMFDDCSGLTSLDLSRFTAFDVTDMSYMFSGCSGLKNLDLSYIYTYNVTDMSYMFSGCSGLKNLDLRGFNTSKVTDMANMFKDCSGLTSLDLSSFDTSDVTNMFNMFGGCNSLRTIFAGEEWSTAAVTYSIYMFYNCTSLVGGKGTTFDSNHIDKAYAHIDGGASNPGYFTAAGTKAYAVYTPENTTLTFYYDTERSSRPGTKYNLNPDSNDPGWYTDTTYANVTNVVFDPSFANARPTSTYDWLYGMQNLQAIEGIEYLNTSEVTNMDHMFNGCSSVTSLDVSHFNTSKVTVMRNMFSDCSSLTSLDLSSFNTSNVTSMYALFENCGNLRTVYVGNDWNTAAVTNSNFMFDGCFSLVGGKGTTYDASHIDKAYAHIDGGASNPGYFTAAGTHAYAVYTSENTTLTFYYDNQRYSRPGTKYNLNTGGSNPAWYNDGTYANVTRVVFDPSFAGARPTTTYSWFYDMQNLQTITGIEYLNTSEVISLSQMFFRCNKLTSIDVSHFNTSKLKTLWAMFYNCSGLTSLDLSSFNTSMVTNTGYMFNSCSNLRTIYVGEGWSTAAVTGSVSMFTDCTSLVGGQGTTYDANHIDKTYAHIDGGPSDPGYFTAAGTEAYACYTPENTTLTFYYDTERSTRPGTTYDLNTGMNTPAWRSVGSHVTQVVFDPSFANARLTTTYSWFYGMQNLQTIEGMEYLNTSEVTDIAYMFGWCTSLTSLDLSHFNTSKVTNMGYMFYYCESLTSLDLSSFITSMVANTGFMFYGCSNLRTIYASEGWSTAAVTSSSMMFYGCTSLVGGKGTTYDSSHVDAAYAHIDGGTSNPGYFSEKGGTFLRGDVNGDGEVAIGDVSALIDYLLTGDATGINLESANCNNDSVVSISDISSLIDYLLSGTWN